MPDELQEVLDRLSVAQRNALTLQDARNARASLGSGLPPHVSRALNQRDTSPPLDIAGIARSASNTESAIQENFPGFSQERFDQVNERITEVFKNDPDVSRAGFAQRVQMRDRLLHDAGLPSNRELSRLRDATRNSEVGRLQSGVASISQGIAQSATAGLGLLAPETASTANRFLERHSLENPRLHTQNLVGRGLGSAGTFAAGGAGIKALRLARTATGAIASAGAAVGGGSRRIDARQQDASDAKEIVSTVIGMGIGTTEAIPLSRVLHRLNQMTGGLVSHGLRRAVGRFKPSQRASEAVLGAVSGVVEEAIQEGGASIANFAADRALDLTDDSVVEGLLNAGGEAGVGGAVGAIINLAAVLMGARMRSMTQATPTESTQTIDTTSPVPSNDSGPSPGFDKLVNTEIGIALRKAIPEQGKSLAESDLRRQQEDTERRKSLQSETDQDTLRRVIGDSPEVVRARTIAEAKKEFAALTGLDPDPRQDALLDELFAEQNKPTTPVPAPIPSLATTLAEIEQRHEPTFPTIEESLERQSKVVAESDLRRQQEETESLKQLQGETASDTRRRLLGDSPQEVAQKSEVEAKRQFRQLVGAKEIDRARKNSEIANKTQSSIDAKAKRIPKRQAERDIKRAIAASDKSKIAEFRAVIPSLIESGILRVSTNPKSTKKVGPGSVVFELGNIRSTDLSSVFNQAKAQGLGVSQLQALAKNVPASSRLKSRKLAPIPRGTTTLPGGRGSGSTILANEVAEEVTAVAKVTFDTIRNFVSAAHKAAQGLLLKATDFMDTLGPVGQEVSQETKTVDRKAAKRAAQVKFFIRKALSGLNRQQRRMVGQVINGRIPVDDAPQFIQDRANRVRDILDNFLMKPAREVGVLRKLSDGKFIPVGGKGKAMPQIPNKKGIKKLAKIKDEGMGSLSDPEIYAVANQVASRLKGSPQERLNEAFKSLRQMAEERLRGTSGYFERTRVELPTDWVEWDALSWLDPFTDRSALFIEGVRQWGFKTDSKGHIDFPKLSAKISQIGEQHGGDISHHLSAFYGANFGIGNHALASHRVIAGTLSNYETFSKLGGSLISALRNSGQRYVNLVDQPMSSVLASVRDFPPFLNPFIKRSQAIKRRMERTGAVRSVSSIGAIEESEPGSFITDVSMKPFSSAEAGNQTAASYIARHALVRDVNLLLDQKAAGNLKVILDTAVSLGNDNPAAIKRRIKRKGLSDEALVEILASHRKLTKTELEQAMVRLVSDTQFPITLSTQTTWWPNHPFLRLLFKFKTFGVRQVGLAWEVVVKEAAKGNPAPMIRFAIATLFLGELYNLARDFLTGKEESLVNNLSRKPDSRNAKDIAFNMINNMIDGGAVGILADVVWGITDLAVGPVGSTIDNARELVSDSFKRPEIAHQALMKFIADEVAISRQIGPVARLDKLLFNEKNETIKYARWRGRAFDFKRDKEHPTAAGRIYNAVLISPFEGVIGFQRSDKTLSYEFAAGQVTAGDVDDAAKYLANIFSDAKNAKEFKKLVDGARQSMGSKAPLGPVKQSDLNKFLSQFTPEDRREAMRFQRQWIRDYERAIVKAKAIVRRKRRQ